MSQTPGPSTTPRDPLTSPSPSIEYAEQPGNQSRSRRSPSPFSTGIPSAYEAIQTELANVREQMEQMREAFKEAVEQNQKLTTELVALSAAYRDTQRASTQAPSMPPPPPPHPLSHSATTPAPAPPAQKPIRIAETDVFDGSPAKVENFLYQCALYFASRVDPPTNSERIIYAFSFMKTGSAATWAKRKLDEYLGSTFPVWTVFAADFRTSFGDVDKQKTAQLKLPKITQGNASVDDYIVRFEEYEHDTGWNPIGLLPYFKAGLHPSIRKKIYTMATPPDTLTGWKTTARTFYRNWLENEAFEAQHRSASSSKSKGKQRAVPSSSNIPSTSHSVASPSTSTVQVKQEQNQTTKFPKGSCYVCGSRDHYADAHKASAPATPGSSQQTTTSAPRMSTGGRPPRKNPPTRQKRQITTSSGPSDAKDNGTGTSTSKSVATTSQVIENDDYKLMGIVRWNPERKAELKRKLKSQDF